MRLFNRKKDLNKADALPLEKKLLTRCYFDANGCYKSACADADLGSNQRAVELYATTSPVYAAVDKISTLASSREFVLKDLDGNIIEEHPVIDLLNSPSFSVSFKEFMTAYVINLIVTGNNYNLVTLGSNSTVPLEIFNVSPLEVSNTVNVDGDIEKYTRTTTSSVGKTNHSSTVDYLREVSSRMYKSSFIVRYLDKNKEGQLWHAKLFNPNPKSKDGLSQLSSIAESISSFNEAGLHNLALLKNGARPSGLLFTSSPMAQEDIDNLKLGFDEVHTGSKNAGKIVVLEGEMKYQETSISQKEMDWLKGRQFEERQIYNVLGVPQALIDSTASTFNNLFTSTFIFYEYKIFPILDKIYSELSDLLLPYYKDGENLMLTYSKQGIPSLESVTTESALMKSKMGIYTVNELRELVGLPRLEEGGDIVVNNFAMNNLTFSSDEEEEKAEANTFIEKMEDQGVFSEEEIKQYAERFKKEGYLK